MKVFMTVKNYRCFVRPARIEISKGFTAFVGVNNAGKSTIMRFLLEFRNLFGLLNYNNLFQSLRGDAPRFNPNYVTDPQEVFSNLNGEGIELTLDFIYGTDKPPIKIVFNIA